MTQVAQDVILKQISHMKNELNRLEQTVKDYFLWLDTRNPTTRAPAEAGGEWQCTNCKTTNMLDVPICQACGHPRPGG